MTKWLDDAELLTLGWFNVGSSTGRSIVHREGGHFGAGECHVDGCTVDNSLNAAPCSSSAAACAIWRCG